MVDKGIRSKIINKWAQGRWTLIASIFSDGGFLWTLTKDTVRSKDFIQILWVLKYVMCFNKKQLKTNVWVTLDNAPVHISEENIKIY